MSNNMLYLLINHKVAQGISKSWSNESCVFDLEYATIPKSNFLCVIGMSAIKKFDLKEKHHDKSFLYKTKQNREVPTSFI